MDGWCGPCRVRERCVFSPLKSEVERRAHRLKFRKRELIFHEGDRAFGVYVIYRGKVKLFKRTPGGRCQILQILGRAEPLGEEGLLGGATYQASAQALTEVELLFLPSEALRVLLRDASVEERLIARLIDRQRRLGELLIQVHYRRAEERLEGLLRQLAREHGRPSGGGVLIDLELTQAELGELCGLTREAVNKHLKALQARGRVRLLGHRICLAYGPDLDQARG